MPDQSPKQRELSRYVALGQVGLEMVSPIVAGVLLDRWLGWTPWLTVIGAVFGFGGGMVHLLSILNNGSCKGSDGSGREYP
jgi:F0F1-type ATP synthase assembly protein I